MAYIRVMKTKVKFKVMRNICIEFKDGKVAMTYYKPRNVSESWYNSLMKKIEKRAKDVASEVTQLHKELVKRGYIFSVFKWKVKVYREMGKWKEYKIGQIPDEYLREAVFRLRKIHDYIAEPLNEELSKEVRMFANFIENSNVREKFLNNTTGGGFLMWRKVELWLGKVQYAVDCEGVYRHADEFRALKLFKCFENIYVNGYERLVSQVKDMLEEMVFG